MDSFWDFSNEKGEGVVWYKILKIRAPIVLAEQILNYFGSWLQGGLKRLKCPFLYIFVLFVGIQNFYFLLKFLMYFN